jgi:hypothetical protein
MRLLPTLAIFLLAAPTFVTLESCKTIRARRTGFLTDYDGLEEAKGDRWVYINPNLQPGMYQRFIVDPVDINVDEETLKTFTMEELESLADYFYTEVTGRFAQVAQLTTEPGPGVGRVRISLTGVEDSEPLMNVLPQTRVSGAGRGGAAMEGEIVDSQSGMQMLAVVQATQGTMFGGTGMTRVGDAKRAIDKWIDAAAERIREYRLGNYAP